MTAGEFQYPLKYAVALECPVKLVDLFLKSSLRTDL